MASPATVPTTEILIEKGSVNLILTSPPYPVIKRAYGRFTVPEWLSWMSGLTAMWKDLLADDGTLAVNLMDVFSAGSPCLDPYVERFTLSALDDHGLHLAGRMPWHSTTKMPHIQWSVRQRVRPKNTVEHVLLFSKKPNPNWDIRRLPKEAYKERSQRQLDRDSARGSERRPSGYNIKTGTFDRNDDGPIPSNLIISGRYILQPEIFEALSSHETGAGGEIQLTDAMARLMKTQSFHALEYEGATYDCGDKVGLLRANVAYALKRADIGAAARGAIEALLNN